ncbi:hypothetical protein HGP29_22825 [Flammeovirga sp. SR4]|uniref:Uncharacterized protein n=1 Tax=Flammeovirga agarivorans TaxID=2726742 RepID=A0A7X8XYB3_9BACT|nr:hypothetical protein [Flammeovirga agarivorans]
MRSKAVNIVFMWKDLKPPMALTEMEQTIFNALNMDELKKNYLISIT